MWSSKTGSKTSSESCVAHSAVLLKPHIANILLFLLCELKCVQHGPITIAIVCNGLSLLNFEEKLLNYTILLVYKPSKIKMSFFWKDDFFFFSKIGIFCKSIAGPLPSVVQTYIQPYSFCGRIKLIICQISHELSVTIHDISTSWHIVS